MPIICNNYTRKFFKPSVSYKKKSFAVIGLSDLRILLDFKLEMINNCLVKYCRRLNPFTGGGIHTVPKLKLPLEYIWLLRNSTVSSEL